VNNFICVLKIKVLWVVPRLCSIYQLNHANQPKLDTLVYVPPQFEHIHSQTASKGKRHNLMRIKFNFPLQFLILSPYLAHKDGLEQQLTQMARRQQQFVVVG